MLKHRSTPSVLGVSCVCALSLLSLQSGGQVKTSTLEQKNASLSGIGAEQRQCWDSVPATTVEREVSLSNLLMEKTDEKCQPIRDRQQWEAKRRRIRQSWELLLGRVPLQQRPLNVSIIAEERKPGYILRKVAIQVESDDKETAHLLIPEGLKGRAPAILALQPTSGPDPVAGLGQPGDRAYGLELALRGYVVLVPHVLALSDRLAPSGERGDTSDFYRRHPGWSMLGKMLWDHQRGVDYLCSLPEVDPSRIGTVGWSLGGHNACLLAAFDERIKAAVSDGGVKHFTGDFNPFRWCNVADVGFTYMPRLKPYLLAGETPTDWHELQALIAPRAYFDLNSTHDNWKPGLAASMNLQRLYRFLGAPGNFDYYVFDGKHSFPKMMRERAYAWLDRYLGPARLHSE